VKLLTVPKRDLIEGLIRGLEVLTCFDADTPRITPSELGVRLNISRAAARRYLLTLVHTGYLESDGRYYQPTVKVLALGQAYSGSAQLPRVVGPYLQRLTRELHFSTNCAVLEGNEAVYVARVNVPRSIVTGFEPGMRLQATTSAAGRVMLAYQSEESLRGWLASAKLVTFTPKTQTDKQLLVQELTRVRSQGYELIESMYEIGLRGIAVPMRNRNGTVVAALSVSMAASSCSEKEALALCLGPLQAAALELMPAL
jgi:IclR family transcriptional regulator, pca regulon regulatory protein